MNLRRAGDVVDKDAALELKLVDALTRRPLEQRVTLLVLLPLRRHLLATEDDALKEVNLVLALIVALDHDKRLLKQEVAERVDVVAFPVFDAAGEVVDRLSIVLAPLLLVDFVRHAHDRLETGFELVVEGTRVGRVLEQLL